MIRLLHIADVHIGASLSGFTAHSSDRQEHIRAAFKRLPSLAEEHGAIGLLVAGDLFDKGEPSAEDRSMVREVFRLLDEQGCGVFVVPGNHDSVTVKPNPYQESLGGARLFLGPEFETAQLESGSEIIRIHGFAFNPDHCPRPLETFERSEIPGIDIVLMQASLDMTDHWKGSLNNYSPTQGELGALEADYVALGDYHRPRRPEEFQAGLTACYSGSFAAVRRSESGPRGVILVEFEGGDVRTRLLPSEVPQVIELCINLSGLEDQAAVEEQIKSQIPKNALPRLTLEGTAEFKLDSENLRIALQARYGFAVVKDRSWYIESTQLAQLEESDTIAGHLVRVAKKRMSEATDEKTERGLEEGLRQALAALEVM